MRNEVSKKEETWDLFNFSSLLYKLAYFIVLMMGRVVKLIIQDIDKKFNMIRIKTLKGLKDR